VGVFFGELGEYFFDFGEVGFGVEFVFDE